MSIEVMTEVWKLSKAKPAAKLVLLAIADHQGEQGAWPSIATLARMVGMSDRTVQRYILELEKLGELRIERNAAPIVNRGRANVFWVSLRGDKSGDVVTNLNDVVTKSTPRGDKSSKSTFINHIEPFKQQTTTKQSFSIDFVLSETDRQKLEAMYPNANLDVELASMIDWIVSAGKENQVKDMAARFRTWMRNADKFAKGALSKRVVDEWFVKPEDRVS